MLWVFMLAGSSQSNRRLGLAIPKLARPLALQGTQLRFFSCRTTAWMYSGQVRPVWCLQAPRSSR
jgi:hypothetical protein